MKLAKYQEISMFLLLGTTFLISYFGVSLGIRVVTLKKINEIILWKSFCGIFIYRLAYWYSFLLQVLKEVL